MGQNKTSRINAGDAPTPDDWNQYDTAIKGDFVPREADEGNPRRAAGSLGTTTFPWNNLHLAGGIYINGEPVALGADAGTAALVNGLVSGKSPANRPGMCGFVFQAGTDGVKISATAHDPLYLKLNGRSYLLEGEHTGGSPIPAALSRAFTLDADLWGRQDYLLTGAGSFHLKGFNSQNIPTEADGNLVILKFTVGTNSEYVLANIGDIEEVDGATRVRCYNGRRGVFNTSAADWESGQVPFTHTAAGEIVRTGFVFVDPVTADPTIHIEKRVVGVTHNTPETTGFETGDMVFRDSDFSWLRFNGTSWGETNRVLIAVVAIETVGGQNAVTAVAGVIPEETSAELRNLRRAVFADNDATNLRSWNINDGERIVLTYPDRPAAHSDIEKIAGACITGQGFEDFFPLFSFQVGASSGGSSKINLPELENNKIYGIYLEPGVENNSPRLFYEAIAPVFDTCGDDLIIRHPNKKALFIGDFGTDADGAVKANDEGLMATKSFVDSPTDLIYLPNYRFFGYAKPSAFEFSVVNPYSPQITAGIYAVGADKGDWVQIGQAGVSPVNVIGRVGFKEIKMFVLSSPPVQILLNVGAFGHSINDGKLYSYRADLAGTPPPRAEIVEFLNGGGKFNLSNQNA